MDWKQLISDLRGLGMTQQQIGDEVGISQAAISELASGKARHPSWETGNALMDVHAKHMQIHAAEAVAAHASTTKAEA